MWFILGFIKEKKCFLDGKFQICFLGKNIKFTKKYNYVKFEFKLHVGEDLAKEKLSATNQGVLNIADLAEGLREKMKFFLEKQEFFLMKNEIVFRVAFNYRGG